MSRSTISTYQLFQMFPDQEAARVYLEGRLWPMVRALLSAGGSAVSGDVPGFSAMIEAVKGGRSDVVPVLAGQGLDCNAKDSVGTPAISFAGRTRPPIKGSSTSTTCFTSRYFGNPASGSTTWSSSTRRKIRLR